MASSSHYTYFRVSKGEDDILSAVEKYKELRLRALKQSPTSFSSTYDTEAAFTNDAWISRLSGAGRETFICAASPRNPTPEHDVSVPSKTEWVAQVTLLGPQPQEAFVLPAESGQPMPASDEEEERWQMLSLFTLPLHRGQGIAKELCREALEYLKSYQTCPKHVRIRLMVKPENHATVKIYRQLQFTQVGKCNLAEALVANGDGELVPKGYGDDMKYSARNGLIMMAELLRSDQ